MIQSALNFSTRPVEVPSADSQCGKILRHLKAGGTLTVAEALSQFGVYALSQRCGELKRAGWPIESEMVEVKPGTRVARYRLGE